MAKMAAMPIYGKNLTAKFWVYNQPHDDKTSYAICKQDTD